MNKFLVLILIVPILLIGKEEKKQDAKISFYEFGSVGCIPCERMKVVTDSLTTLYPKDMEFKFVNTKMVVNRKLVRKHKIKMIPTQVILDEKGKEIYRHQGYIPFDKLNKVITEFGVEK